MQTKLTRFFVFSVTGLVTLAALTNDAFADRRSSLAGNVLIHDQDDVFIYPQLSLDHRNLVSLDYFPGSALNGLLGVPNALGPYPEEAAGVLNGPNAMGGSGLLLFGQDGFAFGIATHREEWYGSSAGAFLGAGDLQLYGAHRQQAWGFLGYNSPLPGAQMVETATPTPSGAPSTAGGSGGVFLEPLQMVDVLLGFGDPESSAFGLRLSAGQNLFRERRSAPGVNDTETWNATVLNLLAGYSLRGDFNLDVGAELGLAFFSNVYTTTVNTEPDYRDTAALAPSFSLTARGDTEIAEHVKLGFLGILHVNAASHRDQFGGTGTTADSQRFNSSSVFFEGGAGPIYELPDRTTIAAYGTVGFGSSSHKDELRDFNTSGLLLPGFKLAFEHWIAEWFAFRTGLSSRYYFTFASRTFDDDVTPNVSATSTTHEFLWSVGVGFAAGNFELSGTFQTPFVTSGPAFIGGEPNGLFGLLNASYKF